MSDADRAAKAARAKALLKKRQREKVGGVTATTTNSGIASPISPSRTLSPAPQELAEEDKRDLGDVFAKDDSDTSWLSSLPRVPSPPPSVTSAPAIASASLLNQVNALQSEHVSIAAEVNRLQASEMTVQQTEALLEQERVLNERIATLQFESASLAAQVKHLQALELEAPD